MGEHSVHTLGEHTLEEHHVSHYSEGVQARGDSTEGAQSGGAYTPWGSLERTQLQPRERTRSGRV